MRPRIESDPESNNSGNILTMTFGIITTVILVTGSLVWRHIRNQQHIIEKLSEEEVIHFKGGNNELISDLQDANTNAQNMPFNEEYEIQTDTLTIEYRNQLGVGEFGIVYKGIIQPDHVVAVKCVKPGASANYMRSAMSELKVMLYIKNHPNVIKLIGARTTELLSHKLTVVIEFCEKGDLLGFLRKHSKSFVSTVREGRTYNSSPSDSHCKLLSQEGMGMTTADLFRWAGQIANGMKYISSLNVIHGDLAARNILLDTSFVAKISDFGLSKKMYECSKYVRKNKTQLPWRWLAEESLTFTEFSISSDVWAFGIVLWEMFTLGSTPYPGQEFNSDFVQMLTSGFRLALPKHATYDIYNLMLQCWRKLPEDRPTFLDIHVKLDPDSYDCMGV